MVKLGGSITLFSSFTRRVYMVKKMMFILLVVILLVAGAVVSMADDDLAAIKSLMADKTGLSGDAVSNSTGTTTHMNGFPYEEVIEKYKDVFFNKDSVHEGLYIKEINTLNDQKSTNPQDYLLGGTLIEDVKIPKGDCLVLMVFAETEDGYSMAATPKYIYSDLLSLHRFRMPNTGKNNPDHIRIIVFMRTEHENLELGKNLEITDHVITVEMVNKGFNVKNSLKNTTETLKQVESILN